jgi:hypothetical protein
MRSHAILEVWVLLSIGALHTAGALFFLNSANQPKVMGKVLGIVYRTLATHLIHKAGYRKKEAHTGAVTLIQRFGGALNLNIHFHMIFLDGVYVNRDGKLDRFRWVKAPTTAELSELIYALWVPTPLRIGSVGIWSARGYWSEMPSTAIWHWTSLMKTQ